MPGALPGAKLTNTLNVSPMFEPSVRVVPANGVTALVSCNTRALLSTTSVGAGLPFLA